jgi:hypothetical protein
MRHSLAASLDLRPTALKFGDGFIVNGKRDEFGNELRDADTAFGGARFQRRGGGAIDFDGLGLCSHRYKVRSDGRPGQGSKTGVCCIGSAFRSIFKQRDFSYPPQRGGIKQASSPVFQKGALTRPHYLSGAGYAVTLAPFSGRFLRPSSQARGNGAPSGAPQSALRRRASCDRRARHSALHRRLFCTRDRNFRVRDGGLFALLIRQAFAAFVRTASSHLRQTLVVGPDGYPGPPECGGTNPARRRRSPSRPRLRLMRTPSDGEDKWTIGLCKDLSQ